MTDTTLPPISSLTAAQVIADGAKFLDERAAAGDLIPADWWERIDLDTLDMADATRCILGQLHDDDGDVFGYTRFHDHWGWDVDPDQPPVRYGFDAHIFDGLAYSYGSLRREWITYLTARRLLTA